VGQRPYEKRHGGLWEFPGGKCAFGEDDAAALKRELQEELGVQVVEVGEEEFTTHDPGSSYLIVFVPVRIVGDPLCREHIDLRWGHPRELMHLSLAPSDRRFVEYRLALSATTSR
jgi:8-oxo-dGTP diphosphatase